MAETDDLTGPVHNIFAGSALGLVDAPNLFWRDGYCYLTTADGCTGCDHAVKTAVQLPQLVDHLIAE